jgi:3-oxoacyl-[acyl-carrier protein] reductase
VSGAFADAGWHVGVHYHRGKASAEAILGRIERAGGSGWLYEADVRDAESVKQMVGAFSRDSSPPVCFVCAAGVGRGQLLVKLHEGEWADVMATNLTGVFHCLRAMAPALQVQGGGSIVVVGSYAGYQGAAGQAAYAASKAGLVGLVKTAALEWGPDNICVNLLWPGWQATKLAEGAVRAHEAWEDHALHRPPALDEVVRTVVRLAQVKDVSGQVWNCDSRYLYP